MNFNPATTETVVSQSNSSTESSTHQSISKYRIHISLYQSTTSNPTPSSFQFPNDIFQPLPLDRPALDQEGIKRLSKETKERREKKLEESKGSASVSSSSSRKRGKSQSSSIPFISPLDPRFGPIQIDWADRFFDQESTKENEKASGERTSEGMSLSPPSTTTSNPNPEPNPNPNPNAQAHPHLSAPVAKFLKKSSFEIPERRDARDSFKTGATEVSFGIVHLFKDLQQAREHEKFNSGKNSESEAREGMNSATLDHLEFPALEKSKSGGVNSSSSNQNQNQSSTSTSTTIPAAAAPSSSSPGEEKESMILESDDSGSILAVLAIPTLMSASDFLKWVEPALDAISRLRMLREPQPNRCLILIKFRDSRDAEEFHKLYDGELFNAMNPTEVAQVVYVTSVTMSIHAKLPYSFPGGTGENGWPVLPSPSSLNSSIDNRNQAEDESIKKSEKILKETLIQELPICAVCLERMDETISGLMTVTCQHTFHCNCLSQWSDGRCPVCRYSQSRQISNARLLQGQGEGPSTSTSDPHSEDQDHDTPTCCTICKTESDLWVCLICGTVGCGRYKEGHAKRHYQETKHLYSLELETQRVWDYHGDGYVHRLIQNKADGKLVELPSSSSQASKLASNSSATTSTRKNQDSSNENGVSNAFHSDKIEAIGLEYSYLLTSQLESQRNFYESQLKEYKSTLNLSEISKISSSNSYKELESLNSKLKKEILELKENESKNEEKEKKMLSKLEKSLEMIRNLSKELGDEKGFSKGLMKKIEKLNDNDFKMKEEVSELKDQVKDLMLFLSARDQIGDGEGAGGDLVIGDKKEGKKKSKKK